MSLFKNVEFNTFNLVGYFCDSKDEYKYIHFARDHDKEEFFRDFTHLFLKKIQNNNMSKSLLEIINIEFEDYVEQEITNYYGYVCVECNDVEWEEYYSQKPWCVRVVDDSYVGKKF
mgnify:CR=1 FL=1